MINICYLNFVARHPLPLLLSFFLSRINILQSLNQHLNLNYIALSSLSLSLFDTLFSLLSLSLSLFLSLSLILYLKFVVGTAKVEGIIWWTRAAVVSTNNMLKIIKSNLFTPHSETNIYVNTNIHFVLGKVRI